MSTTTTARTFLALNAAFSALIGLELIIFPDITVHLMFTDQAGWKPLVLRLLGMGLILIQCISRAVLLKQSRTLKG